MKKKKKQVVKAPVKKVNPFSLAFKERSLQRRKDVVISYTGNNLLKDEIERLTMEGKKLW
jgi:hypothetical protein